MSGERGAPRVSFVMGAFNAERFLPRAIESVMAQGYSDWELVLVNDGSTDGTGAALERAGAGDARVRVLRHAVNRGLAAALNLGWREARGDLVARLDSDDYCAPGRLEQQVGFMDDNPGVAVVGTAAVLVDEAGRRLGVVRRPETHEELAGKMYKEVPFLHPSVMMRRELLETLGGYDERAGRCQDVDLWLRAYRRYRFHNLPEPLIEYRVRRRPPFRDGVQGALVLARAAKRERLLARRGWYAPRFLAANTLAYLGLRPLSIA